MDTEDLLQSADDVCWDNEQTHSGYGFPVLMDDHIKRAQEELTNGIPKHELYIIGGFFVAKSPQSHIGPFKWAIDFLVPDGTPVFSAREGIIYEVEESCEVWGDGPEFRDHLNYITVKHEGGEFSQYCHLAKGSVSVAGLSKGSVVQQGQQIATVGKTGWTDRDHLHFIVFRADNNAFGFKSLQVRFS